jgi:hypothetical protein
MKKTLFLFMFLTSILIGTKAMAQCDYPCPQLPNQPIIENYMACGVGVAPTNFTLVKGSEKLCEGESFTFTLRNSNGTVIQMYNTTSATVPFNLQNLCSGNYSVCVTLNSTQRDCPPYCMSFYFANYGDNCCPNS